MHFFYKHGTIIKVRSITAKEFKGFGSIQAMTYDIITGICFALLTLCVLYVFFSFLLKSRADRITFIRGFKKGKCVAVLLISVPLLCIGYIYAGENVLDGILYSISHVVDFVVLKFNVSKVGALVESSLFYKITIYYCCVLVILNAVLFAFSFIGQYVWQGWNLLVRLCSRKQKLFIFGNNENSISVFKSGKGFHSCLIDNISPADGLELYRKKIRYISSDICGSGDASDNKKRRFLWNQEDALIKRILRSALKRDYTIVINFEDDERNLRLCNLFREWAGEIQRVPKAVKKIQEELLKKAQEKAAKDGRELTEDELSAIEKKARREALFAHLRIYVFGDPKYEALYCDVVETSFGCIRYKNKYQMLAMDFIDKYPLTKFMDKRHIDYSTTFIDPAIDINVCMIGFGKPNRQIFLTSVANNQFLTKTRKGVELKPVNYHLFDKAKAENDKNLNHLYYRFKNEFVGVNADEYLPLPSFPANVAPLHHYDINSAEFYNDLRGIVTRPKGGKEQKPNDVNIVIVSFESDLENIDMAQKLVEKRREWEADDLVIFVRVKKSHNDHFVFREKNVFYIGNENDCVYNIERITKDKFFKMAQMRNEIYDLEYKIKNQEGFVLNESSIEENKKSANKNWFTEKNQLERESSLYGCLSLQSKLNLMGLEYCERNDAGLPVLDEKAYIKKYAENDLSDESFYDLNVQGKRVVKYTLNFPESKRTNLAILEHYRWNSFMLSKGMVPASKEQILHEMVEKNGKSKHSNGKNYRLRRHGNLTTFEGLVEFRKMLAERDKGDEADYDVIKYDYQLLDDAYWLLSQNGYKIVERTY